MTDKHEVELERITDLAIGRPWPQRNGARNLRVLATLIRWSLRTGYLNIRTDLEGLAVNAGLANSNRIHEALNTLEADGWLKWTVGDGSVNPEGRKASVIELLPVDHTGRSPVKLLPDPRLGIYSYDTTVVGHGGSPAYLLVCRMSFNRGVTKLRTLKDIETLTGLSHGAVSRLMPKMLVAIQKQPDGTYGWHSDDAAYAHGAYDESKSEERATKRIESRVADGTHDVRGVRIPPKEQERTSVRGSAPWKNKPKTTTKVTETSKESPDMLKNFFDEEPETSTIEPKVAYSQPKQAVPVVGTTHAATAPTSASVGVQPTPALPLEAASDDPELRAYQEQRLRELAGTEYAHNRHECHRRVTARLRDEGTFHITSDEEVELLTDEEIRTTRFYDSKYIDLWPVKGPKLVVA